MGFYKIKDIVAYAVGNEVVCPDCLKKEQQQFIFPLVENDVDRAESITICDRCCRKC